MNLQAKDLTVGFNGSKKGVLPTTTVAQFLKAGGYVAVFPREGSVFLRRMLELEEELKAKQTENENLQKQLEEKELECANLTEKSMKEKEQGQTDQLAKAEDEKKEVTEMVPISKANYQYLQAHLQRGCSIVSRQLLNDVWQDLSPVQQASVAGWKFWTLSGQAHPSFVPNDAEFVEHCIWELRDVPADVSPVLPAAFEKRFGRKMQSKLLLLDGILDGCSAVASARNVRRSHGGGS